MTVKNKEKKRGVAFTITLVKYKPLPNEAHRAERWSGGRVQRNRKKYTRKSKYKNLPLELNQS